LGYETIRGNILVKGRLVQAVIMFTVLSVGSSLFINRAYADAPIEINDCVELQKIGNDVGYPLNGDYIQGNDFSCGVTIPSHPNNAASQPRGSQYTPSTQPKSDQKMSTVLGIIDSISATELAVKSPAGKIEIAKPTAETQVLDIDGNPTAIKAVKKGARASVSITTEPDGTKQVKRIRLLRASKN